MLNDPLANALSCIQNNEKNGEKECFIRPSSKIIKKVIEIMQKEGYIGSFETVIESKGEVIKLNLLGSINKCGVIKPRYNVKKKKIEKFEERYLLAEDFGIIIMSTSNGMITHKEAKEKGIGGKLIAYCY